ncbi:MAG: branched-chain amino acid ABC transporter permease [Deltaproteobacteria bacterium]|nr:branched-chain amino acid ABC transporter permease [Deltaproteobacteria bacterium]
MNALVQVLLLGIALGGVYALMASGLTLIFGVMRIVNIAHAAFMMISAYITFWAFTVYQVDPIVSLLFTMPIMFGLGVVIYRVFFASIAGSEKLGELSVLLTFSLALILEGVLGYLFTNTYRSTNPDYAIKAILFGPFFIPASQLYATVLSLLLLVVFWIFLRYSRTGNAIRATTQNRESARIVGVDVERISMIVFGLGTALAGASGSLMTFLFSFYPGKHWEWIAILLSLIVLGGMGSMFGALIGAFLLAIASSYVSFYFGPNWSPITFFLALFLILLIRPQGLLGKKMEA